MYCYVHCNPITDFDALGLISKEQQDEVDAAAAASAEAEAAAAEAAAVADAAQQEAAAARSAAEQAAQNGPTVGAAQAMDAANAAQGIANQRATEASMAQTAATQARANADQLAQAANIANGAGQVVDAAIANTTFPEAFRGQAGYNIDHDRRFVDTENGQVDLQHVTSASLVVLPDVLGFANEVKQLFTEPGSAMDVNDFISNNLGGVATVDSLMNGGSVGDAVSTIVFNMKPTGRPLHDDG